MDLLYKICLCSSILLFGIVVVVEFVIFCTSVYSCFSKKIQGKLLAKIAVMLGLGCIFPWLLWLELHLIKDFIAL